MRAEIRLSEDTTTLFVRWEIFAEGGEPARLKALGGPLSLEIEATDYVDNDGKQHAVAKVEVPLHPHAGVRNFGQAKFTKHESRRAFVVGLQEAVTVDAGNFVADSRPGSVPATGHVIRKSMRASGSPA